MQQIADWLKRLGVEQYAHCFDEHDIDLSILRDLTDQDLEKIGVQSLGHRRKLLRAIADLNDTKKSTPAAAIAAAAAPAAPRPLDFAERRQVTVMFSDLVGSTALSARMDPEDLREVISAYQNRVAETVRRFDGFVAKYMGDGVLIYFGYPQAHEDDAECAVRAALALVEAVAKLGDGAGTALRVRVGIATGLVVVGDLRGEGATQEHEVVGETPNLAARLQALAEPDTVVIAGSTRCLLGELFEYRALGSVPIKGFGDAVPVWQVTDASAVESRFEAQHENGLTALVGREEELELLLRRWRQAASNEGQVVLLSGEPGIGKSRLIAALQERLQAGPHTRLRYFFSPHHTASALFPIISQLQRAAGFQRNDTLTEKFAKLEALLRQPFADRGQGGIGLIADLLSLPSDGSYSSPELSAQKRKEETFAALVRQLETAAHQQPVLMVYEDVQWIDPTSRELLDMAVERVARLPVLLVITFRPEFQAPWAGQAHVTTLTLARLTRRDGIALVGRVVGNDALSAAMVEEIVERTDGIPLFVEELTKAVLEAGAREEGAREVVSAAPLLSVSVPATLHDSLMARLDHLGPAAKEIAQIGAAIGREFSYELIAAIAPRSEIELQGALARLSDSGLVFRRGTPPQAVFLFKHALLRDAAYGSLLRGQRERLHAGIVSALEKLFPEIVTAQPELIARHCAGAGLVEKAVAYRLRAGQQAIARSTLVEAIMQLRKGIELIATLSDSRERVRQELALQSALGGALVAAKGNSAPETGKAYARARELCEQLGDAAALVPVLSGLSTYHQTRAEYAEMRRIAAELLRLGEQGTLAAGLLVGNRSMGLALHQLGELAAATAHFERVLGIYKPETDHLLASVAAFDMRAVALTYLSWDLFILGCPGQAASQSEQAVAWSRSLHHPHTLAFSLNYAALVHQLARSKRSHRALLAELILVATEHRFPQWLACADVMRGYALGVRGATAEGLALIRKGLAKRSEMGASWNQPYYLALLALTNDRAGQADEAINLLDTAIEIVERTGERWFEAELCRLQGEWHVAHRQDERIKAEASFRRAIDVAQNQQAKMWELRASTGLARLWRDQGKRSEARDLLAPIYDWFTEGFDTLDLKEAKALLDELHA